MKKDMMLKRILQVVGLMDRAGAETMLMNLYRAIDKKKFQFDFITFTNKKGDYDEEIISLGGRIIPIIADNNIQFTSKLKNFLISNPEYKIVHAHTLLHIAFVLKAAKAAGIIHRIAHSHSTSNGQSNFMKFLYEKWAIYTINNYATKKISCGHAASGYLFPGEDNVKILSNAIDIDYWSEISERHQDYIKREFGDYGFKIIQVGRFISVKNHEFTLEIAKVLEARGLAATIYFVGQGILLDEIQKKIYNLKLDKRVKILGLRTDIAQLMAGADVMIVPSFHEGFPVILAEAQAVGLPTIASTMVSKEVDLGVGLVNFESLQQSADLWVDKLISKKERSFSTDVRIQKLKNMGFDVNTNVKVLEQFYTQMD
jgi:glycosyltransferase EpsF